MPLSRLALFLAFFTLSVATSLAPPPIVYTIAGSDSGGGAGIQADLHAIHAMGGHGCSAITCLTAQNSVGVTEVHAPPVEFLRKQLETLSEDLPPMAVKIGMLGTSALIREVATFVKSLDPSVWIVLDPVMISTSGHRLMDEGAQQTLIDELFPHVHVLTPNLLEAEALLGRTLETEADVEQGARELQAMGVPNVLIKGGHRVNGNEASDYFLSQPNADDERRLCDGGVWLVSPRYDTQHTHGTGCTLSSALATALAVGSKERTLKSQRSGALSSIQPIDAACLAKAYVTASSTILA